MRNGSDAFVPPKPQGVKGLGPGSLQGAQSLGLASGPQKGNLGTVDRFKAAGLKPPKGASEIGFFNATHEHGEPMKNLIAKLKRRRNSNKAPGQASYQPANGISSSR